jgi:hypothetical protein
MHGRGDKLHIIGPARLEKTAMNQVFPIIKRANARNSRVMIPSHNRGDKYLHEIHF